MQLNQTTLRGILAQIFSVNEKYVVPKQGNWWNPQENANNIQNWIAYRIKENRPRTTPFYKELVSLFLKLDKALFETETESLWLKSNQIFQDSLKSDYLEHTKTSISKIITKLEDLPAPFLIGLVDKFISPFTNFTKNFIYFLDSLNECKNQNYCSISTKPSENEVKNLAANILANLPQITNQTDIKIINSKINQLNNKAGYRKIKKTV